MDFEFGNQGHLKTKDKRNMEDCGTRVGVVVESEGEKVVVRIEQMSACAGCHSRDFCSSSDKKEKEIEVHTSQADRYAKGDRVKVGITTKLGFKAVLLAFLLPFAVLMFAILLSLQVFRLDEALSCIIALLATSLYYLILYKYRRKIQKQFIFTIEHA